jgi:hypothetical protein
MTNARNQSLVENCKFKFKCHKTWQSLVIKNDYAENRRFCNDCSTDVYLVNSEKELEAAILKNYCVAIPVNINVRFPWDAITPMETTLGILDRPKPVGAPLKPPGISVPKELSDQELSNLKTRSRLSRLLILALICLGIYFFTIKK